MIIQETKKILETHLGKDSVQTIDTSNGVFRCAKTFSGAPYQVLYVDCSNTWLNKELQAKALEVYLEKYLLKDYYSNSGPLQWNFYYAFVSSENQIGKADDRKLAIETDELYSRKYVWSPVELDAWLTRVENLSKPAVGAIERDLSSVWINGLRDNKLDMITMSVALEEGLRQYMSGKPLKAASDPKGKNGQPPADQGIISLIRQLQIKKFRDCHNETPFNFGKVNLLTGVNGSGKTSLMEAIELLLCGKFYRNQSANITGMDIQALVEGFKKPLQLKDGNLKLYKQRDKEWYNNPDQKFNRLDIGFSKYNFYNTDAAYILANNKKDEKKARAAFEDIALGDEVNELESKMIKYVERFRKEERLYEKLLKELRKQLLGEEKLVKQLMSDNSNPDAFLKELLEEAKKEKWVIATSKPDMALKKNLASALSLIQSIINNLKWAQISSYGEVLTFAKRYDKALSELNRIDKALRDNEKQSDKNEAALTRQQEIRDLLTQLTPYYKVKTIKELPGLSERIDTVQAEVSRLQALKKIYDSIPEEDLASFGKSISLKDLETALIQKEKATQKSIRDLVTIQQGLLSGINQLDRIIKEIKAKGLEFTKVDPTATECPLCQTPFEITELVKQIQRSKRTIRSSAQIDNIVAQINNHNTTLAEIHVQQKTIELLKRAFTLIYNSQQYSRGAWFTWNLSGKQLQELDKQKSILTDLQNLQESFELLDLDEDTYAELLEALKEYNITVKDAVQLSSIVEKTKEQQKQLDKDIRETLALYNKENDNRIKLLADLQLSQRNSDQVIKRSVLLSETEKLCEKLSTLKTFSNGYKFPAILSEINSLRKMLEDYEILVQRKIENDLRLQHTSKELNDLKKRETELALQFARSGAAASVIEKLLTKHNKQAYLEQFIEGNKKEILEIFRMIHTPKEFTDLKFNADGDIVLVRQNGKDASLSEISTGQRSALSLAVFSALNRKLKKGPNLLMFDDPVANVDDLNVLSYFDYLREVAIRGNRQIFFATANENLAFLFTQKFSFLDKEFVTIPLGNKIQLQEEATNHDL
jgi:DNA repair exonuclease SbcCD ATPase subunit